ncbi:plasmid mobilization protein [Gordonia sp. (in: high G+C Gram-positive bacteria)]|uniref:plasmid mobilization protein n=1 Tax=Gordonia sp. (in: high G+C Gram-positive bacteria) TaxID=84139 RepID=UPI003C78E041
MGDDEDTSRAFLRRRRRNVVGGRSERIEVTVTPAEREQLRNAAENAGVSVPRLMVSRALAVGGGAPLVGREEKVAAWKEAIELRNLVAAIGVNMNQIAAQANTEHDVPAEFGPACAGVDRALAKVTAAFGAVYNPPEARIDG